MADADGTSPYVADDRRFPSLIQGNARVRRLATGFEWAEGPVWFADHQVLLFSDIPSERILRLTMAGELSVFRQPSGFSNGHTRDRQGRLVSCQHGTRSVTRTEWDGRVTTLADGFGGGRLNSPNDVVVARDGAVWFTDPTYGILTDYEGYRAAPEQPHRGVYRIPPEGGAPALMVADFVQPNGLAFSPDETVLYVAESGRSHDEGCARCIRAFDIAPDGSIASGRGVFAEIDSGVPDGIRVDGDGRLWCSAADGVHVFDPGGARLGHILVPETVSNLTFGGPRLNRLLMTATTSVYAVALGAVTPPRG